MAKLGLEELKTKYSEKITDQDILLELLEDLTDSLSEEDKSEVESIKSELESTKNELEMLKQKYIDRFLSVFDDNKEEKKDDLELEEKEVIDVKEI